MPLDSSPFKGRKGTCKVGQRSDLTGCTPASGEVGQSPFKEQEEKKTKPKISGVQEMLNEAAKVEPDPRFNVSFIKDMRQGGMRAVRNFANGEPPIALASRNEFSVAIMQNSRELYMKDGWEPAPAGLWMDFTESHWGISDRDYRKLPQNKRAELEANEQLKYVEKQFYERWISCYFPREHDKWYWDEGGKDLKGEEKYETEKQLAESLRSKMMGPKPLPISSKSLPKQSKLKVRLIDAEAFRNISQDAQEFELYGTHIDFPTIIPENEVWIDGRATKVDQQYYLINARAYLYAISKGQDKDAAYDYALAVERSERERKSKGGEGDKPLHNEVPKEIYIGFFRELKDE